MISTNMISSCSPTYQVDELSCEPDLLSGENLDAGGQAVCTGTYVVTQDDIDAGKVR